MDREQRLKILGLSEREIKKIKKETLKELDPEKHTDSYLDFSETSLKYYNHCSKLIKDARHLIANDRQNDARQIIEQCIFKYNTAQSDAFYIATKCIHNKDVLKQIVRHYENNKFLFESRKLRRPIEEIKNLIDLS